VGFEPTIQAFERAKIFHASDRAATAIGGTPAILTENFCAFPQLNQANALVPSIGHDRFLTIHRSSIIQPYDATKFIYTAAN
jgi:hypothetical protein